MKEKDKALFATSDNLKNNQIYTVVVPIFDNEQAEWTVQIALDLARAQRGRVVLVGLVQIPAETSLSTGAVAAQECRTTLERLRTRFAGEILQVKPRVRVDHKPWQSLAKLVAKERASLVVLPWRREGTKALFGAKLDNLLRNLDCHIVVASGDRSTPPRRILMPIRGSQEMPMTLQVGLSLTKAVDGEITLLYAVEDDESPVSQKVYKELVRMSQGNPLIKGELQVKGDVTSAVMAYAGDYDLIILGVSDASANGGLQLIGRVARQLRRANVGPLLVVKTHRPPPVAQLAEWDQSIHRAYVRWSRKNLQLDRKSVV